MNVEAWTEACSRLFGTDVVLWPAAPEVAPASSIRASLADPVVAVMLRRVLPEGAQRAAVELDPRLGACLADRLLGGEAGAEVPTPTTPLDEGECGALAYAAASLCDAVGTGWQVVAVVTSADVLAVALQNAADAGIVAFPAAVRVGHDRGHARLWMPDRAMRPAGARADLVRGLWLELSVRVGHAILDRDECAGLRPGDVLLPDELTVARGPQGVATVMAVGGRRARWHCDVAPGVLKLRAVDVAREPTVGEAVHMGGDERSAAGTNAQTLAADPDGDLLALVGDAPVELVVELARFRMPIEELATLAPGAIVATGTGIGETVTLRAADRAVASGELVDVDGEVGVRIVRIHRPATQDR
ncbi:MAG: FliM/FliN family flagellar motor switch protein [Myxococcota bacterium]|nr:FliM/FliN family flagellar motor switch protein [Myxococcota bacterium]MDW8364055.1 FliM/FliN family flagellar motor switch protein [Myxococcales bacterium]